MNVISITIIIMFISYYPSRGMGGAAPAGGPPDEEVYLFELLVIL